MQHDLCYLYNFSEEKLFYVLLLSIDHYNRKNYVASRFSPTWKKENQMVAYASSHACWLWKQKFLKWKKER
jgi:hypothetical protein